MEPEKTTYKNLAALVRAKGVDANKVKIAKKIGLDGFNLNNSINWPILEKALTDHAAEIEAYQKEKVTSLEELKREEKTLGNEKKRLEIKKLKEESVDPEDWYQAFSDLFQRLSTQLKAKRHALLTKCSGYESVVEKEFDQLFANIQEEAKQWTEK